MLGTIVKQELATEEELTLKISMGKKAQIITQVIEILWHLIQKKFM